MYRIGFDAKRAFTNFTGLGNHSRLTISSLSHLFNYNQYYLYTPQYREHPLLHFSQASNITIRKPEGLLRGSSSLWRSYGVARQIKRDEVDLYHGLSGELPFCETDTAKIVTIHDLVFLRYPNYYNAFQRFILREKTKRAIECAHKIIAVSRQTADDIIHFFGTDPSKIEIIYQGCDAQFYKPAHKEQIESVKSIYSLPKRFLISVGKIDERKNTESIVKALAYLPSDVQLYCFGRWTPYVKRVLATAERAGVKDRVKMVHDADFSILPALYSQAEALVYLSHFEGFGVPVLEGITYGVPVITSNRSSMPEVGGDSAIYANPSSVKEIADSIEMVLSSPTLKRSMIEKGLIHAKEFRNDKITEKLFNLYKQTISKQRDKDGTEKSS